MPLLREQDLRQIEQVLYTPVESELVGRQILRVNNNFSKFSSSIGYQYYERKGYAKILALGAGAKDVPFVGEDGGEIVKPVYDIVTGIRYSLKEIEASQFLSTKTNVPSVRLDMLRVETARRFVAETENKLIFVGDANYKIYGLLNTPGITLEDVAQGAFSGTPAQKRQWANKTSWEILADLRKAKTTVRQQGLFNPDTLVLPPEHYDMLDQPYSSESTMTIRMWLSSQGLNFPKVFSAKELSKDYNGLSVDAFLLMDSSPQVAEIAITRDMELLPPVYDIVGNSEQVVIESLAGVIVRYPKAIYVGKGI